MGVWVVRGCRVVCICGWQCLAASCPASTLALHAAACSAPPTVSPPPAGSVIWKSVLRFGGTLVAGVLGLGALYFVYLCNGLSFENQPPKVRSAGIVQLAASGMGGPRAGRGGWAWVQG